MSASLQIVPFSDDRQAELVRLWAACGLLVPHNNPYYDIERKRHEHPELFLLGLYEGELVGSVMGGYDGHRGWANYLAVAPPHQRRGYARALMRALETRLLALGCPKINLQVRQSNVQVLAFYEAIGYHQEPLLSLGRRLQQDPAYEGIAPQTKDVQ